MKVLLAGAFGNLGYEILKALVNANHEVIAADLKEKEENELKGKYTFKAIDATKPETLNGLCVFSSIRFLILSIIWRFLNPKKSNFNNPNFSKSEASNWDW